MKIVTTSGSQAPDSHFGLTCMANEQVKFKSYRRFRATLRIPAWPFRSAVLVITLALVLTLAGVLPLAAQISIDGVTRTNFASSLTSQPGVPGGCGQNPIDQSG